MEGSILYHPSTGQIQVKRKGYYFIYSQTFFTDGSGLIMGHDTYINEFRVMASVGSVVSDIRKYNTKYHGGVFLLQENDTISVRLPYTIHLRMNSEASFFGAFLLGNAERQGKQIENVFTHIVINSTSFVPSFFFFVRLPQYFKITVDTLNIFRLLDVPLNKPSSTGTNSSKCMRSTKQRAVGP